MPLSWINRSNRKQADRNDKQKSRKSDGEYSVVSNSGAGKHKGDLVGQIDIVETKFTRKQSFSLKASDIKKMIRDVKRSPKRGKTLFPVMEITMVDDLGRPLKVIVMQSTTYDIMREDYANQKS